MKAKNNFFFRNMQDKKKKKGNICTYKQQELTLGKTSITLY